MRTLRISVIAALAVIVVSAGGANAAERAPDAGQVACVGLTCPGHGGGQEALRNSRIMAQAVSGPGDLERQTRAGYYEFGAGTTLGTTAVAYVIPPGQLDKAPAEVRDLPVVKDSSAAAFNTGTNIIFDAGTSLYVPSGTPAAAADATTSLVSALNVDAYNCSDTYFCIYDLGNFSLAGTARRLQFHDINHGSAGWVNLGDYSFNDAAESVRNRRDRDSWLAYDSNGNGARRCYDSHSSAGSLGSFNNEASSTFNSAGDAGC